MLNIFTQPAPQATAADLRASLSAIDIGALRAALAAVEQARAATLLTGNDDEIAKAEQAIERARRDLDRASATAEELSRRIALAAEQEAAIAFDALAAEAEAKYKSVVKLLEGKFATAARVIEAALPEVEESARLAQDVVRAKMRNASTGNHIDSSQFSPSISDWLRDLPETTLPKWARALVGTRARA